MPSFSRLLALPAALVVAGASLSTVAPANAGATKSSGTVTIADKANDWELRTPSNKESAAAADLKSVSVNWKTDNSITATFTLAAFPTTREGTDNFGEPSVLRRLVSVDLAWYDNDYFHTSHNRALWYIEDETTSDLATHPRVSADGGEDEFFNISCRKGSVKVDEAKAQVILRVPASCHRLKARTGARYTVTANANISAVEDNEVVDTFGIDSAKGRRLVLR